MKTRLLSILCILLMSIGIQAHDLEPLHVDGRYMKNSKGDIVTLHGYCSDWGNLYFDIPEVRDGAEKDLLLFKITTDSILNSGWKVDYARLHFLNHLTSPSDFDGFVRNNLFETYYLPRIEYLNSKGIYVLLMADIADIADEYLRYVGDLRYQGLLKYWNYVSSHPRIKNNPGVMFELANEPGAFQGSDGSLNDFRTLKAYFQPMVDIIRNNGCEQIIWVPGSGCQWEYRGYASYPIEGDNIGYAVHAYDWCGGRDYENIRKFWDVTVKAASNMAPIIVSETGWEGRYALNLIGDGTKPEDPPLTSDFGINIKRVMDELGNVSFNLLNPSEELINTGLPTETPSVINDTEGPLVPGKEWYKEYAKTKYTSSTSLSAISVELIEAPTTVLPSKVIPLTLMATFNDGRKWNVAGDAVWTSSDESVLVVNHGNIFVKSEGTATVRGQYTDGTGKDFNTQFTVQSQLFPLTQEVIENSDDVTFDEATHTFSGAGDIGWAYTEKKPVDGISQCKSIDLQDYQYIVVRMNEPKSEGVYGEFKIYTHEAGYIGEDEEKVAFVDLPPGKSEVIIDLHQLPNIDLTHIEKVVFWVYNSSLNVKEVFLSNDGVNPLRYVQSTTIKASDTTMNYGDEVPQLPYTISGFANVGMPKLTTTATKTSPVGTYDITAEAGSGADDGIRYLKGRMTVMKAPLMVGVEDVTINEGDAIPTIFTLTYDGWRNNDNSNALTSKPIASTTAASSSLPGTYPITISGGEATNYHLIYGQGTLTIKDMGTWNDLVLNSDLEGNDVSCFYKRENYAESETIVSATIGSHSGKGSSRGIAVKSVDNAGDTWNTQFFVRLLQTIPAGTKYRLSFDYKANNEAYVLMEIHAEPGEYIYYDFDHMTFTPSWQHYESEGTITEEMSPDENKMRTIAFDLAYEKTATTYYFDNIVFEIYYPKGKEPIVLGDLNDDRSVSITDVVLIVDVIAGSITDENKVKAADVNKDGYVTITDCVAAIDLIAAQTKGVRMNRASAMPVCTDYISASMKDNLLTVNLDNENHYTAFQMVVTMPEGMTLDKAVIDKLRGTDHQLTVRNLGNGQYLLAGFSMGNSELAGNSGRLLTIGTKGQTKGDIIISDIEFATAEAEAYRLVPITISNAATGIYQVENREWSQDDVIFDLQGRRVNQTTSGLYIMNGSKLIVK